MKQLTCVNTLCITALLFSCSSRNDSSDVADEVKENVVAQTEENVVAATTELGTHDQQVEATGIPDLIKWNPINTWEEFAIGSGSDVFPDEGLNNYVVWEFNSGWLPVILLISNENDFIALSEPDDELDEGYFKVRRIELPLEAGFGKNVSQSYTYYDFSERDFDQDGILEYIISAEINGMAEADNGMRPVRYLKSAVFTWHDYVLEYSIKFSNQYNAEVGTTNGDVNEAHLSFLHKKYHNLDSKKDGLEKSALLRSLVDDMGIAADNIEAETGFGKVGEMGSTYVVYASFVGSKYFVSTAPNAFSELKRIDEDFYPLMLDLYQMTDVYAISSAQLNKEEVQMTLRPLSVSESATENIEINFSYNGEHWTLMDKDSKWFPAAIRDGLQKIQDD